jgi:hypothetical protein
MRIALTARNSVALLSLSFLMQETHVESAAVFAVFAKHTATLLKAPTAG